MTTDSLWTVDDVAKRLKVSERTVYRMLKTGRLRGAKVGRTWRFRDQDVLDMFQRASRVARASLLQRSPVVSKMPRCPFRSCAAMRHPATSTVTVRLFEADAKAVGIGGPQPLFRCLRLRISVAGTDHEHHRAGRHTARTGLHPVYVRRISRALEGRDLFRRLNVGTTECGHTYRNSGGKTTTTRPAHTE